MKFPSPWFWHPRATFPPSQGPTPAPAAALGSIIGQYFSPQSLSLCNFFLLYLFLLGTGLTRTCCLKTRSWDVQLTWQSWCPLIKVPSFSTSLGFPSLGKRVQDEERQKFYRGRSGKVCKNHIPFALCLYLCRWFVTAISPNFPLPLWLVLTWLDLALTSLFLRLLLSSFLSLALLRSDFEQQLKELGFLPGLSEWSGLAFVTMQGWQGTLTDARLSSKIKLCSPDWVIGFSFVLLHLLSTLGTPAKPIIAIATRPTEVLTVALQLAWHFEPQANKASPSGCSLDPTDPSAQDGGCPRLSQYHSVLTFYRGFLLNWRYILKNY